VYLPLVKLDPVKKETYRNTETEIFAMHGCFDDD